MNSVQKADNVETVSGQPAPAQRWWSRLSMAAFPPVMRLFGYTFRTGKGADISADAEDVIADVWQSRRPPSPLHQRYFDAPVWIVGYRKGRPIACMALYDVREVSFTLDHIRRAAPEGMDPATYRDLGRLAISPSERGGSNAIMIGLLREMFLWCQQNEVTHLLSASSPGLYQVFRRYNPSAARVALAERTVNETVRAYHQPIIDRVGPLISYTFDLRAFDALDVMFRAMSRPFRKKRVRQDVSGTAQAV